MYAFLRATILLSLGLVLGFIIGEKNHRFERDAGDAEKHYIVGPSMIVPLIRREPAPEVMPTFPSLPDMPDSPLQDAEKIFNMEPSDVVPLKADLAPLYLT